MSFNRKEEKEEEEEEEEEDASEDAEEGRGHDDEAGPRVINISFIR